jgi:hypothetical protein
MGALDSFILYIDRNQRYCTYSSQFSGPKPVFLTVKSQQGGLNREERLSEKYV